MMYPLLWLVSSSLKPGRDVLGSSAFALIPTQPTLRNYSDGWAGVGQGFGFGQYFLNSLVLAVLTVAGSVVSCSLAAYAFGRLNFRFKRMWFGLMLGSIMLPFEVVIIPQYVLFHGLGWIDTYLPLLVPQLLAQNAFLVFLITQFLRGLPRDVDDAAALDGAGPFRTYLYVILPLSRPALVTAGLLTFLSSWGNFIAPLIYINDPAKYTLPLGLASFVGESGATDIGPLLAMSALSLLVPLLIFVLFQRSLLRGISTQLR
jgi:multiple sugar transport system permease protein